MTFFDRLADMFGAASSELTADLVVTATYTPHSGDPSSITGLWYQDEAMPEPDVDGEQDVARGVLVVDPGDVSDPDDRDQITIGGVVWAVASIGERVPLTELQLETRELYRVGGAGSRTER